VKFDMKGLGFTAEDVLVITGAAGGIGIATAKLASRSGLTVWGLGHHAGAVGGCGEGDHR
jgi:NADP-dependent 3-hydroxy acid dehydrogenase YdfG